MPPVNQDAGAPDHSGSAAIRGSERITGVKKYILFDHDGVLVDTEFWYFKAGERALADIGFALDKDQYLRDMTDGSGTWAQARAAGIDCAVVHNDFTEAQDFSRAGYRIKTLGELTDIIRTAT
jgi:FMN phosphatase YigB (HAD superfamily)